MPSVSEMAKPLTGPLAFQKRIAAVIRVVTLASKNGAEGFLVSRLDRDLERLAERQFFAQSLVNQHARVDRQADGQDDAGDARQGEDEAEHRQRAHQEDDVDDQGEVRDQAGES